MSDNTERGVCYIGKLPPKMNLQKLRELLQPYGIDRVYFKPAVGSSKVRTYTQGWVEFLDKKVAKMCAISLNGTNMGINSLNMFSAIET